MNIVWRKRCSDRDIGMFSLRGVVHGITDSNPSLQFPILICDLSTDAIIGTDTLGSVLPHTLDIKNGLLFTDGGVSLQDAQD